eukprot:Tamp_30083.p1 GENE.Tamp_30083~~Tamp_30083.p1  ORF type:complete len:174 (-),score=14.89 Tamp_30083:56-577(-)
MYVYMFVAMQEAEGMASGCVEWGEVSENLLTTGDHRAKGYVQYAANCVEAVIGAIAVDRGTPVAVRFAKEGVIPALHRTLSTPLWRSVHGISWDPISDLQQRSLLVFKVLPEYRTLSEIQLQGQPHFHIGVYVAAKKKERLLALGEGSSLALARRNAATNALANNPELRPKHS